MHAITRQSQIEELDAAKTKSQDVSRVRLVFGCAHSLGERVLFTHISPGHGVAVTESPFVVVNIGKRIGPDNGFGAMR